MKFGGRHRQGLTLADLRAASAQELLEASIKNPRRTERRDRRWLVPAPGPVHDLLAGQAERHRSHHRRDQRRGRQHRRDRRNCGQPGEAAEAPPRRTRSQRTSRGRSELSREKADTLLKLYPARDDAQAKQAYHDVYRDINFAGHRTWARLQSTTGKAPALDLPVQPCAAPSGGQRQQPARARGSGAFLRSDLRLQ